MGPALVLAFETETACRERLIGRGMDPAPAGEIASYLAQSSDLAPEFPALAQACGRFGLAFEAVALSDLVGHVGRGDRTRALWTLTDGFAFFGGSAGPALAGLAGSKTIGCPPALFFLAQDKFRSGAVLAALGLPTPPTALARGARLRSPEPAPSAAGYFVKPNRLGAKIGIWPDSHAADLAEALLIAGRISARYGDDAVIQPYVPGRNIRVSYLDVSGRGDPSECGIAAVDSGSDFQTMADSLALHGSTGALARRSGHYAEPALEDLRVGDPALAAAIEAVAIRAAEGLGLADVWSMDFRASHAGGVHLIEFEVAPGLPCFDFRAYVSARWGLSLADAMATVAAARLGPVEPAR